MNFKYMSFVFLITLFVSFVQSISAAQTLEKNNEPAIQVVFKTSMGPFTLEINAEKAPKTAANFLRYVDEEFYKNTLFHRLIPGFMVQGGGFARGMQEKKTHKSVKNESDNQLKNTRGTIAMARRTDPDSATSQFFINLVNNKNLNAKNNRLGYTVFGKVIEGMDVIDKIVAVPIQSYGPHTDAPKNEVVVLSARRKSDNVGSQYIAGVHYILLDNPVATRDINKIEVVEAFSYGCPHCYALEPLLIQWLAQQASDVDFWAFPAVWSKLMRLYARTYYASQQLSLVEQTHRPLFSTIVVEQKKMSTESELAGFFAKFDVDEKTFSKALASVPVQNLTRRAEALVKRYTIASLPEFIINGKYRVDPMRAGGRAQMLAVIDFLIEKERALLKK